MQWDKKYVDNSHFYKQHKDLNEYLVYQSLQVSYVDHKNKTVFNGSDIGKEYSAKALLEKFPAAEQKPAVKQFQKTEPNVKSDPKSLAGEIKTTVANSNVLVELLHPQEQDNYLPHQFKKRKKKKQSKGLRL